MRCKNETKYGVRGWDDVWAVMVRGSRRCEGEREYEMWEYVAHSELVSTGIMPPPPSGASLPPPTGSAGRVRLGGFLFLSAIAWSTHTHTHTHNTQHTHTHTVGVYNSISWSRAHLVLKPARGFDRRLTWRESQPFTTGSWHKRSATRTRSLQLKHKPQNCPYVPL